jgi:hypothetical protein
MTTTQEVKAQLDTHEAVCAERYKGIEVQFRASNARLKRIEAGILTATIILVGALGWAIDLLIKLVSKL